MDQFSEDSNLIETGNSYSKDERRPYHTAKWWSMCKQDIARYKKYRLNSPVFITILTEQDLRASLQYRVALAFYQSNVPFVVKASPLAVTVVAQKFVEILTGITIPYQASIGPGLYVGHFVISFWVLM